MRFFPCDSHQLYAKAKTRENSRRRFIVARLARQHTTLSYPQLAQRFGGLDHTSVINMNCRAAELADGTLNSLLS